MGTVINRWTGDALCEVGHGPNAYFAVVRVSASIDIPLAGIVPCQLPGDNRQGFHGKNLTAHIDRGTPVFARGHVGEGFVKIVLPSSLGITHGLILNLTVPDDLVEMIVDESEIADAVKSMGFDYTGPLDEDIPEEDEQPNDGPIVTIGKDGRCQCDAATICPLGRIGAEHRCTEAELIAKGIKVVHEDGGDE